MNSTTYGFADELMKLAAGDVPEVKAPPVAKQVAAKTKAPPKAMKAAPPKAMKAAPPPAKKVPEKDPEEKSDLREVGEGLVAGGRMAAKVPLALGKGVLWTGEKLVDAAGTGVRGLGAAAKELTESETGKAVVGAGALGLMARALLRRGRGL